MDESLKTKFGARLRELRKRAKLSQQELGARAHVDYKFVGGVERGVENPTLSVIEKLAAALGVEVRDLFEAEHLVDAANLRARAKKMIDAASSEGDELQQVFRVIHAVLGAEHQPPKGKRRT